MPTISNYISSNNNQPLKMLTSPLDRCQDVAPISPLSRQGSPLSLKSQVVNDTITDGVGTATHSKVKVGERMGGSAPTLSPKRRKFGGYPFPSSGPPLMRFSQKVSGRPKTYKSNDPAGDMSGVEVGGRVRPKDLPDLNSRQSSK